MKTTRVSRQAIDALRAVGDNLGNRIRALPRGDYFTDTYFLMVLLPTYLAAFIWVVLIPANFWDDLQFRNNPDPIRFGFQAGSPLLGYFWIAQLALPHHDLMARLFVLFAFFAIALLLRQILSLFHLEDERTRNAIVLITATLPIFQSRFLQAILLGTVGLLCFSLAVLLLIQSLRQGKFWKRLLAYPLFMFSFAAPSFLVLYGFVILLIVVCRAARPPATSASGLAEWFEEGRRFIIRAPDALVFPFAYYILKMWLFPMGGAFAAIGYQSINLPGLLAALASTPLEALRAVLALGGDGVAGRPLLFAVVAIAVLVLLLQRKPSHRSPAPAVPGHDWRPLALAYLGVMMSVFPYAVIGRTVGPFDFDDRYQATLMLTVGAAIVLTIKYCLHERLHWIAALGVTIWGVANNITTYNAIIVDGHTQNAVIREIAKNEAVLKGSAFVVDTRQWPALSRRRTIGTAQLNCMLKDAFGDERRFAAGLSAPPVDWKQQLDLLTTFRDAGTCFREFAGGVPQLVTILQGSRTIDDGIGLSMLRLFSPAKYQASLDGLVRVTVTPLPPGLLVNGP